MTTKYYENWQHFNWRGPTGKTETTEITKEQYDEIYKDMNAYSEAKYGKSKHKGGELPQFSLTIEKSLK